ncbi:TPA: glutathione S-transferase N-terminal domain-containing protein [Pseudomonas aeruginosa]|uniref:glutathione S-transferase family protein n=1 Tax=Pseudomonas aeruginosa TaxID=287 RepID=UPI000595E44F|nr:glutathione S-transferase N-terminal domain-containing protein [Pseudomonas aeruginosa]EKU6307686.1 glutathione S-transferase N-terminal domain-containing protein [Pseudomonas aeruginosa]EKX2969137.1 glutathione S-transferase N-terminal domain-containing protein [Pseudomonas aeruginosa]MDF5972977.1 glutathione S-transferase N-terminal domain-containing protein [Pseudomonas aeruginosa]MDF5977258.1 glutathione S-transferase N-terminal domain-containing protein [Pseudomonas aeruginosa]MDV26519
MKHTLYFSPGACSLAPHILLEWIGAPYEIVKVSPGSIELYNLNSSGTVPVLTRTDGWKLSQAGAIITYLVERFPEKCLGGDRTVDGIAEFAHWIAFFTGDLHPAFFPIFAPQRYISAKAEDHTNSEDELKMVRLAGELLVIKHLIILNNHLESRRYILDQKSALDAYAFPMLRWAQMKLPNGLESFGNLNRFFKDLSQDPQVVQVLYREGLA